MINFNSGILVGALLSVIVVSGNAQAIPQSAPADLRGKIAAEPAMGTMASTPATYEIRVPKRGYIRRETNANPWAGGDTHDELRAFSNEKP